MPLFEKLFDKPRTPGEVVPKAVAAFQQLEAASKDKDLDRALDSITRYVAILKIFLFGDEEHEITKEAAFATAAEVTRTDLMSRMVKHQYQLDFETRKDVAQVFGAVVRLKDGEGRCPGAQYVRSHFQIVEQLFQGYEDSMYALNCGSMIRDCIRDEQLAKSVLDSSLFMRLFEKVEMPNFEIASDAFSTFKDLLTRHKAAVVAAYLQEHYTEFFAAYMKLLQSPNYVTRRQSLKLLGELLLDRSNVKVMVKFVSDVTHLMQMMVLLKDQSRSIQFEAFHVFKVFVANPNKPQPVVDILTNNRDKLLKYLEEFHTDKDDDEQFKEEKAVIIKEISLLGQPPAS